MDRQGDKEGRAFTNRAFHDQRAAVGRHDPVGDGEAQASSGVVHAALIQFLERLEDARLFFGRNANARIADAHQQLIAAVLDAQRDRAFERELAGIRQQDVER